MKKSDSLINLLKNQYEIDEKRAFGLILAGMVIVNDNVFTKPNVKISTDSLIRIKDEKKYVSRGAYKLLTAFKAFNVDVNDKICMDIGSSTGGFTEVLLMYHASKVYAVDCGTNQLDYKIRSNPNVISLENTKIMDLRETQINDKIEIAVMDVSFTSSLNIILYLFKEFKIKRLIVLIKPQFEYKRLELVLGLSDNFNGVVERVDADKIVKHIAEEILQSGLRVDGIVESDITGTKGNVEFLFDVFY